MTMSTTLVESIKRRAAEEAERDSYPAGFPVLPPVPAGSCAEPGSYRQVEQLGKPMMVVRGADGQVRAFYNTCQHRGAALVADASGTTGRRLTCPYHNWVYSLEGELVGYPDANNFSELDRDCLSLTAIRCETWGPLIFLT